MKKTTLRQAALRLLFVAMMCIPWVTQAQESLTVYDGTSGSSTTNSNVPVWGTWADNSLQAEVVYLSTDIDVMSGGTITELKYYANSTTTNISSTGTSSCWNGTCQIFMKEITDNTLSAFSGTTGATVVYDGPIEVVNGEMTITLSTPYTYGGGNLLIGFYYTTGGAYKSVTWTGETGASGISIYGRSGQSYSVNSTSFVPKTTFSYEPASTGCDMPESITVSHITTDGADVAWVDNSASEWKIRYKTAADADYTYVEHLTTQSYTLDHLDGNTTYSVGVAAVCSGTESSYRSTSFTTANPCAAPTNLQVSNITPESADLTWVAGYQETSWTVKYKKSTVTDWASAQVETVTGTPEITLSHLDGLTTYNVRVYNCDQDDSFISGNFTTGAAIPLVEPFATSSAPTGWTRYNTLLSDVMNGTALTSYGGGWNFGTGNNIFDSHARINIYGTSCKYWLVTPSLVMEDNVQLTFDLALTPYGSSSATTPMDDDKFVVLITTDGGTTWTVLRQWDNAGSSYVYANISSAATGEAVAIDLSSYDGQSIAIAFYGESTTSGADMNLHIDNVRIDYIPSCAIPTALTRSNVSGHTVDLSWTMGDAETAWQICLNDDETHPIDIDDHDATVTGTGVTYQLTGLTAETPYTLKIRANCGGTYSPWSNAVSFTTTVACPAPTSLSGSANGLDATITWEGTASSWEVFYSDNSSDTPDENNIDGTATTNTYTKTGLPLGDHYFWVRTDCTSAGEGYSNSWAGPVSVHIGYCVPNPSSHDGSGITGVTFGTGSYVVENGNGTTSVPATSPYYGDYSSMIGAVQAGVESTIAITTATGNYPYTFVIWVDFDNSMSFEDSEVIYVGKASTGNGTLNATFTIPPTQATGDYRMRIYGADSYFTGFYNGGTTNWGANHDPCASGSYRHAHDYTLRLLEAPSCLTPTNIAINYTGGTSAEVTWDGTASTYNIDINGTVTNGVTSPYTIPTALTLATTYAVKLQADCGGSTSEWSNPVNFTTDLCMPADMCEISYSFTDQYNDSWNGASISIVDVLTSSVIENVTMPNVSSPYTGTVNVCNGRDIQFVWNTGSYDGECSYTFTDASGVEIFSGSGAMSASVNHTVDCPTCVKPNGLTVDNTSITAHEAELSWTEFGSATSWQICLNGDETNLTTVNTNPFTLTGLTQGTDYTVKIRAYCDATDQSAWTNEVSFSTPIVCPKPTALAVTDGTVTASGAELSWTENGTATTWQICLNGDETNLVTANTNPFTLTSLIQETAYTAKVRAYCDAIDQSAWSDEVSFTTLISCAKPTNLDATGITAHEATLQWDGTASNYNVRYRVLTAGGCTEDFEGSVDGWTTIDADGDGYNWGLSGGGAAPHNGSYCVQSASYDGGALTPDNYLVSPIVALGGSISFYACAQDADWPAEHFGVAVSTTSPSDPAAFTTIQEWTMTAGGTPGAKTQGAWGLYTVDLSAYAGQTGYVAIRHFNCTDLFYLNIDDIVITAPAGIGTPDPWTEETTSANTLDIDNLASETIYEFEVQADCGSDGTSNWAHEIFATAIGCQPVTGLAVTATTSSSATVTWNAGTGTSWKVYLYDNADNMLAGYPVTVNAATYTFDALSANTPYKVGVRNDCSGDFSVETFVSLRTACGTITTIPYEEGFEGAEANCWTFYNFAVDNAAGHANTDNFYIYANGYDITHMAIQPEMNAEIDGLALNFWYKCRYDGNYETIEVGYLTDVNDLTTFVLVGSIALTSANDGVYAQSDDFFFTGAPAGSRIAISYVSSGSSFNNIVFIDDVKIFEPQTATLDIIANQWNVISSPMNSTAGNGVTVASVENLTTGSYDLYQYNEAAGTWTVPTNLEAGRGYIYRRAADATLTFTGVANTGAVNVPVTCQGSDPDLEGFNLIGNPYASSYSYNDCYTLDPNGSWLAQTTYAIPAKSGVLVKVDADATLVLNSSKSSSAPVATPAIAFTVNGNNFRDVAIARFNDGKGLPKIGHLNPTAPVLSIPVEGRRYAIANLGSDCESFDMNFSGNGEFTLTVNTEALSLGYLHLYDKVTGTDVDLLSTHAYTFNATTGDMSARFLVKFRPDFMDASNGTLATWNGRNWVINANGDLQLFDALGRNIHAQKNTVAGYQIPSTIFTTPGVYIIRLGEKTQKIVVK